MTVFKGYMKVINRLKGHIFLYFGIFFTIILLIQSLTVKTAPDVYSASSVNIGIVNSDSGPLAESLIRSLSDCHRLKFYSADKSALQEDLYYGDISYIIYIPEHFFETVIAGDGTLQVTSEPGSYNGSYVDRQLDSLLNNARVYYAAGFSEEEIAVAVRDTPRAEVHMAEETRVKNPAYNYYFNFASYLFSCAICYAVGAVLAVFGRDDIRRRMAASAIPARRQTLEGLLATAVVAFAIWTVTILVGLALFGREIGAGSLPYLLLNSFLCMLVTLTIAYLIGSMVRQINTLNGIVTTISLGMGFLCGVFVDMEFLGAGIRKVSQFLPLYWYVKLNDMVCSRGTVTAAMRSEVWKCLGIEFAFAAAIFCVVLVVGRRKNAAV